MKKVLKGASILLMFFIVNSTVAQVAGGKDEFGKLFDLFLMEDYATCYDKAVKYMENEKYSSEPEPIFYVSMSLLELSKIPEAEVEFPNALKDAMKYAYKAVKKDSKLRNKKDENRPEQDEAGYYTSENQEFLSELKMHGLEAAEYYFNEDNFSKAASGYSKVLKFAPEDANVKFMFATCQILSKNLGEGQRNMDAALEMIKTNYVEDEVSMPTMEDAFVAYTNYLVQNEQGDKAKEVAQIIYESLPPNNVIDAQYNKLK